MSMWRSQTKWLLYVAVCLVVLVNSGLAKETVVITPDEAAKHLDEVCTVEFEVKSGRVLEDKHVGFLNSSQDVRDQGNFTVFLGKKVLEAFKAEKSISNPAAEYVGKKIRVSGKITLHKGKPQIEVERPNQIELVKSS